MGLHALFFFSLVIMVEEYWIGKSVVEFFRKNHAAFPTNRKTDILHSRQREKADVDSRHL